MNILLMNHKSSKLLFSQLKEVKVLQAGMTADKQAELLLQQNQKSEDSSSSLYTVIENTAYISVSGPLFENRNPLFDMFGMTHSSYAEIREAVHLAENDSTVETIAFNFNTPGGYSDGLDLTAEVIANTKKHTKAIVLGSACSAGYYLASQTTEIVALSRGSEIGSIGVAVSIEDDSEMLANMGIKEINLTNSQSTEKRPDISTEEGLIVIRESLDEMYELFENRVEEGRTSVSNFSLENVRSLKGKTTLARKALKLGLIDSIASDNANTLDTETETNSGNTMNLKKEISMNLKELLAENPELKTDVDALVLTAKTGATAEMKIEAIAGETKRIVSLLGITRTQLSESLANAIDAGLTKEELAVAMLESAQVEPTTDNTSALPTVTASAETVVGASEVALANNEQGEQALTALLNKTLGKKEK